MDEVFADAAYWIAVSLPGDQWHGIAVAAHRRLGQVTLITTDEVLSEFLTAMSRHGDFLRNVAAEAVRDILQDASVRVIKQSRQSFLKGLARYEQRLDKGYSLQDCVAMNIMEAEGITQVLTSDHNFEQEGFTILMKLNA